MKQSRKYVRGMAVGLMISLMIGAIPAQLAEAATLQLYNHTTKATMKYKDASIRYIYNGTEIALQDIPGILTDNGVAIAPYYELFVKGLGLKCTKNSKNNTLTFEQGGTTLVLTLGSKTALVNGKKQTMNAAPVSITYKNSQTSRILVPTRFVAETFGYDYNWNSATSTVTIKKALTLAYNHKQVHYTGITGQVSFDGVKVTQNKLPSILISNTAMLRAYQVFCKAMGVSYAYNQTSGKITFRKGDICLVMQEGSTTAYINEEPHDCGVAPLLVTNCDNGAEALLVPGRFVAEALGYDYEWNAATSTSEIRSTEQVGVYRSENQNTAAPEEQVFYSFVVDEKKYLEYENIVDNTITEILSEEDNFLYEEPSQLVNITKDDTDVFNETYVLEFTQPVSAITSEITDNLLTVTIGNTFCESQSYDRFFSSLVTQIQQSCEYSMLNTSVQFSLSSKTPYYHIELSEDRQSCRITVFPNYLVGLEMGQDYHGTYLRFKGLKNFTYDVGMDGEYQVICFQDTANTLGNIIFPDELFMDYFEYAVMVETEPTQIKLQYLPQEGSDFYIEEDANELYLYFNKQNTENNTQQLNQPLFVTLPSDIAYDEVTVKDDYLNQQFLISIPGNHMEFYQSNPISNTYSVVDEIKVSESGNHTTICIRTKRIQALKLLPAGDGLQLTIANPSQIYDKIVVLDAGHGGIDPGAMSSGYQEKDLNFTILNDYTKSCFEGSDIKVYFTRLTDVKVDLYERADFATKVEADMFISLHMNSASSSAANGTSVYYSLVNSGKNSGQLDSRLLSAALVNRLSETLGTKNLGVKTANFVVVKETQMPAALIELAFLSNASDRKLLTSKAMQKKAAQAIFETVEALFQEYPTRR